MNVKDLVSGIRRVCCRLSGSAGKVAAGMFLLATVTTAWSQTATYPYTVLYKFPAAAPNAVVGNLALDPTAGIYGVTLFGGETSLKCPSGCGEIFHLSQGKLTFLVDLGREGLYIHGSGLIRDRAGNLYGEDQGFYPCCGAVYEIDTKGNTTRLASFNALDDGTPSGGLTLDKAGNLLGFTSGGSGGFGEIFKIDQKGNKTVLAQFDQSTGSSPLSPLVLDAAGNIYGAGSSGGDSRFGYGTLFKLSPDGTFTVLHTFNGQDGASPSGVAIDNKGNLFGFTEYEEDFDMPYGAGSVFEYDTQGNFTTLYAFTGGADGNGPVGAPLLFDSSIYGVTYNGGDISQTGCPQGCGVVFRLSPSRKETVLHTFSYPEGFDPTSGLVTDGRGHYNLYGAAAPGIIYKVGMIPQVK